MKKIFCLLFFIFLSVFLSTQEIQHDAVAINIEVPVRVFKGKQFIDNLTLQDFELFENGSLQDIEAVYLIRKASIQREEARQESESLPQKFDPKVSRHFILIFEVMDYLPRIKDAIDYFFNTVVAPGDSLQVVTPARSYSFKTEALERLSRDVIAKQLNDRLRTDITLGTREYKNIFKDYLRIYRMDFPMDLKLLMLKEKIRELKAVRYLNEQKFQEFAQALRSQTGQKNVFFFYQKEMLPFPSIPPESMEYLEFWSELVSFQSFDAEKIKQAYSDSSITVHFLYITKTQAQDLSLNVERMRSARDMETTDISIDIFDIFNTMARTTGGLSESSANPAAAFKKAADAAENYYLLYYTPKKYQADGKFRTIKVKVKGKNYRIIHRAGYVAD